MGLAGGSSVVVPHPTNATTAIIKRNCFMPTNLHPLEDVRKSELIWGGWGRGGVAWWD
jgi:hypothetical protein